MDMRRGGQEEARHTVAAAAGNLAAAGEDIAQAEELRMLAALEEEGHTGLGAAGPIAAEGAAGVDIGRLAGHHTAADRAGEHRIAAGLAELHMAVDLAELRTGLAAEAGHIVVVEEGTAEEDSPGAGGTVDSALEVVGNLAEGADTDLGEDIGSVVVRNLLDLEGEQASGPVGADNLALAAEDNTTLLLLAPDFQPNLKLGLADALVWLLWFFKSSM
jgi:hypothetical protein